MSNTFFQFKQFIVHQDRAAMKVCTDSCLFGAWVANLASKESESIKRALDIGTGTGLLSLIFAQKNSCKIDAVEIDSAASEQAAHNISLSPWKDNIEVRNVSLQEYLPAATYDLIISNPPFFEHDLKSTDDSKNAAKHDSTLSIETLIHFISNHITTQGKAALLLPFHRSNELELLINNNGMFVNNRVLVKQSVRHDYFRTMFLISKIKDPKIVESEISIRDENGNYSSEFVALLKEYYLAF